jgi:hypothetical protein
LKNKKKNKLKKKEMLKRKFDEMSDDVYEMYDIIYELFISEYKYDSIFEEVKDFFETKEECVKFIDFVCKNLVQ